MFYVLILATFVANAPASAVTMQEFSSQAACKRAGEEASDLLKTGNQVSVRFACVAKG